MFVLMMQGRSLSATLPEDFGLSKRFWYWYGASGQRYIHSIYCNETCPPVPGAVFVVVSVRDGSRRAISVGRFSTKITSDSLAQQFGRPGEEEIHVHLLTRDDEGAQRILVDLLAAMTAAPRVEPQVQARPVQLLLLAA